MGIISPWNFPFAIPTTQILMALTAGCSQTARKQAASDPFVEELLGKMTLEEKVGQMTQITLEVVSKRKDDRNVQLDAAKLREAIVKYHVGSILNCGGSANTFENWQEILTTMQDLATKETRLKIPIIYGIDSIHGANYITGATLFPQSFAMSASGNVDLVTEASVITARETRAAGIPWNFNPVLDMSRNPLWSRFWENYGEDPYLSASMAYAYVRAQQGDNMAAGDKVAACMKHYLGYSVPLTGKDRTPAWIPERMLRELFLPSFAAGAKAGVATVMVNSSEINGIAASQREAVKIAVLAGIDMSMVPNDYSFYTHLVDLVQKGEVPMARINEAVRGILKVKKQLGLFANAYPDKNAKKNFATAEATKANLRIAQECVTLLKNANGVLPLAKDKKVLVTGPTANLLSVLNGGWTITWQGDREDLYPAEKDTVLEAVQKLIGKDKVSYVEGTG